MKNTTFKNIFPTDEEIPLPPPLPPSPPPITGDLTETGTAPVNNTEVKNNKLSVELDVISRHHEDATNKQYGNEGLAESSKSKLFLQCGQEHGFLTTTSPQHMETSSAQVVHCNSPVIQTALQNSDGEVLRMVPYMCAPKIKESNTNETGIKASKELLRTANHISGPQKESGANEASRHSNEGEVRISDPKTHNSRILNNKAAEPKSFLDLQCQPELLSQSSNEAHPSVDMLIKKACQGRSRFDNVFGTSLKDLGEYHNICC